MIAMSPTGTTRTSRIRFGRHWLALEDVRSFDIRAHRERHCRGSAATVLLATVAAMIFAVGVIENGWRTRFWLGCVVCALIALSAVLDAFRTTPIVLYRFDIQLTSGKQLTYTTADAAETARLREMLGNAAGAPGSV